MDFPFSLTGQPPEVAIVVILAWVIMSAIKILEACRGGGK